MVGEGRSELGVAYSPFSRESDAEVAHGGKKRGEQGEDQSTGDDFITTRHSSTTLKYQKSGGPRTSTTSRRVLGFARRVQVFCTMLFLSV